MQKITYPLIALLLFVSCSNDIQFNSPALQGTKNYTFWRANDIQATITGNGDIQIIGISGNESLTINIENSEERTYFLGSNSLNSVAFEDIDLKSFSTLNGGDGEIILEDYDVANGTITGNFKFNSYSGGEDVVNFINGIFYEIPIENYQEENEPASNILKATVNSNNLIIDDIEILMNDDEINVIATNSDNTNIKFHLPKYITIGAHTLNASSEIYAQYINANGTISSSQYGTLLILEHDLHFKRIKGSFSFNTGHPYNIDVTNGTFLVHY